MCEHSPTCPAALAADRFAAHVIATHPEQGWSLLCNGVVAFDDYGALLPDGQPIPALLPRRSGGSPTRAHRSTLTTRIAAGGDRRP
jgi:hypothetical protein